MSARETTLSARWSKREKDLAFHWPASKPDGHLLYNVFCGNRWRPDWEGMRVSGAFDPSFVKELEARGYDITTLRFSVKAKHDAPFMLRRFRDKARDFLRGPR